MKVAICVLAKDEAATIGNLVNAVAGQSICRDPRLSLSLYLVANGCTDDTVPLFTQRAAAILEPLGIRCHAFDYRQGGKSRSWNKFVHDPAVAGFDLVVFVDSDVAFLHPDVLADAIAALEAHPDARAWTSYPVKDIAAKRNKGLLDRLSLATSRHTRYVEAINGQLYAVRASVLASIWLPDETPGEDGFVNAMITTDGFTRPPIPGAIVQSDRPTHYFEAHSVSQFFRHERRMMVGTAINCWIFEYLWSLNSAEPVGPHIARLNVENPDWVADIIGGRVRGRKWVIPRQQMLRRLVTNERGASLKYLARLPLLAAATLASVPAAAMANAALKRKGAASLW